MKKLLLVLFAIVSTTYCYATTKSEKELNKLFTGMTLKDFKSIFGDPSFSKYEKDTKTRMLLYTLYKKEGGFVEYHMYFVNDTLSEVMRYKDKHEEKFPIADISPEIVDQKALNYTIEGKSLVVSKIIEGLSLNNEQIRNALMAAISRSCNGATGEIKMNEPTRVLYHGVIDKVITFDWIWGSINVFYSIDVAIKEGRIRIKVIGEEIDWHQDKEKSTYYFSETYPIGIVEMKEVPNEKAREMIRITFNTFQQYISVIEEELHKMENDDW